jgi:hypothetical protein
MPNAQCAMLEQQIHWALGIFGRDRLRQEHA